MLLIRTILVLLIVVFGVGGAIAPQEGWSQASYPIATQELDAQSVHPAFTPRVLPPTGENLTSTGAAVAQAGNPRALDGVETTWTVHANLRPSIATNRVPAGYTRNADGSVTGPRGASYSSTNQYSADGKLIYRDRNGGYFTLDGGRVRTSAPTDYSSVPIYHVCTNKCNVGAGGNPTWTPQFKEVFDNAGLNINSEINKIAVPGHRGPHPQAYHQYVYGSLNDAVSGIPTNTPAYTQAVTNTLNRIKAEAVTPGSQVNRWLTGQ